MKATMKLRKQKQLLQQRVANTMSTASQHFNHKVTVSDLRLADEGLNNERDPWPRSTNRFHRFFVCDVREINGVDLHSDDR